MSMLIPFWVWILLGFFIGWKVKGYFTKKFSFIDRVRKPFAPKKRKPLVRKKPPPTGKAQEPAPAEKPKDEMTGKERLKAAAKKGIETLAKPWELLLGHDEEDDDE